MVKELEGQALPRLEDIEDAYDLIIEEVDVADVKKLRKLAKYLIRLAVPARRAGIDERALTAQYYVMAATFVDIIEELEPFMVRIIEYLDEEIEKEGKNAYDEEKGFFYMYSSVLYNIVEYYSDRFDADKLYKLDEVSSALLGRAAYLMFLCRERDNGENDEFEGFLMTALMFVGSRSRNDKETALKYLYAAERIAGRLYPDISEYSHSVVLDEFLEEGYDYIDDIPPYTKGTAEEICFIYESIAYYIAEEDPDGALDYYWRAVLNRGTIEEVMSGDDVLFGMSERYDKLPEICRTLSLSVDECSRLAGSLEWIHALCTDKDIDDELIPYLKAAFSLRKMIIDELDTACDNEDRFCVQCIKAENDFLALSSAYRKINDKVGLAGICRDMQRITLMHYKYDNSNELAELMAYSLYGRTLTIYDEKLMVWLVLSEMIYDTIKGDTENCPGAKEMHKSISRRRKLMQMIFCSSRIAEQKEFLLEEFGRFSPDILKKIPDKILKLFDKTENGPDCTLREALVDKDMDFSSFMAVTQLICLRSIFDNGEADGLLDLEGYFRLADKALEESGREHIHRALLMAARAEDERGNHRRALALYCRIYSRFDSPIDIYEEGEVLHRISELCEKFKAELEADSEELTVLSKLNSILNGS